MVICRCSVHARSQGTYCRAWCGARGRRYRTLPQFALGPCDSPWCFCRSGDPKSLRGASALLCLCAPITTCDTIRSSVRARQTKRLSISS
ncbi:hypothetical protein IE81DRAFT_208224 [Ceraceosorus guamensis]|uniref:Uncharacterized protein n=1 Tax=Ceraceosorus guamensis TaxID=1522189 RepID=A0A316W7W0_9BASI|nr:hypothetical protein IE81DRAFT_208224 [Ceraceosorus guamensis]PWN45208.1 hypothetical protein IE81DRAFT_208224 [Ceraceosorus guamensis]